MEEVRNVYPNGLYDSISLLRKIWKGGCETPDIWRLVGSREVRGFQGCQPPRAKRHIRCASAKFLESVRATHQPHSYSNGPDKKTERLERSLFRLAIPFPSPATLKTPTNTTPAMQGPHVEDPQ